MKKIAIVRRNGLGDLLCTYPLICHLKKLYPQAELTLFVDETNASLLPFFIEKIKFSVIPKKGNKYFNLTKVALKHSFENFDMAISAKTSPMKMMNLFLFFLRAKKRVAFVEKKSFLINAPVFYDKAKLTTTHQALKALKLISPPLDFIPHDYRPVLKVPSDLKDQYGTSLNGPLLLISGSTSNQKSRLNEKKYADFATKIYERHGFSTLLVSMESDRKRAEAIASYLKSPFQILFPRNFDEFMVLLDEADLYFLGDGGAAHIGAGLNKHEVVLFGSVSANVWRPLNEKASCLEDTNDVNLISDETIWAVLNKKCEEVISARKHS